MSQQQLTWIEKAELMLLLFVHGMALAAWFVPMGGVLESIEHAELVPYAFATSAIAALLSPLFFGAMADRSVPPLKVLRWLSVGTALLNLLVMHAMTSAWNGWLILACIQMQSLLSVPTNSVSVSIVLSRLTNSQKQFGAIRALGTLGWMAGCWLVSAVQLDQSTSTFILSSGLWIVLAVITLFISQKPNVVSSLQQHLSLRERLGLDAIRLLKVAKHRAIFVTVMLVAIPFAAFYPYTPACMSDLGLQSTSAWMSLGQATEVGVMLLIGGALAKWSLRHIIGLGLCFGIVRYLLYSSDVAGLLLLGVALHGCAYTFIFISAQIYLSQQVPKEWQTRAQALLTLMHAGLGSLAGYILTGTWYRYCEVDGTVAWQKFWLALAAVVGGVLVYFWINAQAMDESKSKSET